MARVKLFARHWGLIDLMHDVLKHHDVRLQEPWEAHVTHKGDEDIVISTFAYQDLNDLKGDKPVILYATDPVPLFMLDRFKAIQKEKWLTVVLSEKCYPQEICPIEKEYTEIPFAIDASKYAPYSGTLNKVLVANRKARDRWTECVRGATGLACSLEEFLGDIPFDILEIPDKNTYRQLFPKYKVMFYYSNSPYTIVMWEAMTLGMPMVGFNHHHVSTYKPIEKYLPNFSTDRDTVRKMLKDELAKTPQRVVYNINSYESVVAQWDKIIEEAITKFKTV